MNKNNSLFIFFAKHIVFLLFVFFIQRVIFYFFNFSAFKTVPLAELLLSITYSLKLDFSASAFILAFPLVVNSIIQIKSIAWLKKIQRYYFYLILTVLTIIGVANSIIYKEWNSILNNRALIYLKHPKEIFSSLNTFSLLFVILLVAIIATCVITIYNKLLSKIEIKKATNIFTLIINPLFVLIALFIIARGGFQLAPANISSAYFSNNSLLNHITVNPNWYLLNDILETRNNNKFRYYSDKEVEKNMHNFISKKPDSTFILTTQKPNIIFLVIESFSANAIGYYGCKENLTPNFDSLVKEGIIFDSIYSSGFRTEQGLINIFSGFPAQPNATIITQISKTEKLPSLFNDFKTNNYHTSFYYGGEIEFANIGAYLRLNKVNKISSIKDYSANQKNSKWGAHDEFLFKKVKNEINNLPEPFFSVLLTLSNHEPFELPNKKTPTQEEAAFKKTIFYTDSCLGDFINFCKQQKWYSNSLIVIVADHGHRLPYNTSMAMAPSKHIPLLFIGGAIKKEFFNTKIKKIANQHDIPATLLEQTNQNNLAQKYIFSQSLFNSNTNEYAYFTNENILGWKQKKTSFSYSFPDKKIILDTGVMPDTVTIKTAKSFLQKVYSTYLNY